MTQRLIKFTVISGCGWLIDVGLTIGLVQIGLPPFWASMVGAGVAVSFVYIVALSAIFRVGGVLGARGFPPYVIWQCCAIPAASVLVAVLAHLLEPVALALPAGGMDPLSLASGAAKAAVTPVTLLANYLFMRWLTERLRSAHERSAGQV